MPRKVIRYSRFRDITNVESMDQDPWYQIDRAAAREEIKQFIDKVIRGDIITPRDARIQIDFAGIEAKYQAEEDAIAAKEQAEKYAKVAKEQAKQDAKIVKEHNRVARIALRELKRRERQEAKLRERKKLREMEKELSKLLSTKEVEVRLPKFRSMDELLEFVRRLNATTV